MTPGVVGARTVGDEAYRLGEGARWVGGRLVFVDILDGRLLELPGPQSAPRELARLDVPLGAVAPTTDAAHPWVVAAGTGVALLGPDARLTWLDRPEDRAGGATRMNDGVADPTGRFWAGSMAYGGRAPLGSLYRTDPDGSVTQVWDGLAVVNGPAFSPDGRVMYLDDTTRGVVLRFAVSPDGSLGEPVEHWRAAEGDGSPDGATVDDEGHLWVAMWGGSQVVRLDTEGTVVARIPLPARQPTSICLTSGTLYVTSATENLADPAPSDGRLYAVDLAARGLSASAPPAAAYSLV